MSDEHQTARVPIQLTHGCLVASLQGDLDVDGLDRFRTDLLERVHASQALGVILDVGGVEVLDSHDFEQLRRTISMVALLGARSVLVGLGAGTISALVDLDVDVSGVVGALDVEDAFRLLEEGPPGPESSDPGVSA